MSVTFRQVERDEGSRPWPYGLPYLERVLAGHHRPSANRLHGGEVPEPECLPAPTSPTMASSTSSSCSTRTKRPHELGAATHGADIHDQGDTVAGRVNDDMESDRDDELARDEDFARTAAVPASSATPRTRGDGHEPLLHLEDLPAEGAPRRGPCSATIRFYERLARERGLDALYLTVNKRNEMAIRAYKAKGFEVIDAVENRHRRRLHHGRLHHGEIWRVRSWSPSQSENRLGIRNA